MYGKNNSNYTSKMLVNYLLTLKEEMLKFLDRVIQKMPAHCTATVRNASQMLETARKPLKNKTENISAHSALKAKVK